MPPPIKSIGFHICSSNKNKSKIYNLVRASSKILLVAYLLSIIPFFLINGRGGNMPSYKYSLLAAEDCDIA